MKIALVHDYLNQFGGAERVVSALHELWPDAPIYTSIYDQSKLPANFKDMDIRTSFMQKLPFCSAWFRAYVLLYPLAFESFDLSEYDVILSSSSAWAKGIKKRPDQLHLCYCHAPMRFVWRYDDYVKREAFPQWLKMILPYILAPIKRWDLQTTEAVDLFIANSKTIADRIKRTYNRESVIINPPVELESFKPSKTQRDYFLVVARLAAYKRLDVVVRAFSQLDLPLKIVGEGPAQKALESLAGPNIEFLGRQNETQLASLLSQCQALIFPGEEDFGIVPLEAMAAGRPVIAFRAGGALETVSEGETGLFFDRQDKEALKSALKQFQFMTFDQNKICQHVAKFGKLRFQTEIKTLVENEFIKRNK